jgi:ATP-dependent DNA helicase RecQ
MAKYLPHTAQELKQITGFGDAKVDKYGQQFLDIILEYAAKNNLSSLIHEKPNKKEKKEKSVEKTNKESTTIQTLNLYKQGLSTSDIATQRNLSIGTIEGHLAQLVKQNEVDVFKLMEAEKINAIVKAIETIDSDSATALLSHLGNSYSYSELRYGINYAKYLKEKMA